MRFLRPLISLGILALFIFLIYQFVLAPFFYGNKAKVVHMIDPDSYIVMQDGKIIKVQLIGVDSPEINVSDGKKNRQCFGGEAEDLAANLFFRENREITMENDNAAGETDPYGRSLRYVYLPDGRMLNEELIKEGLARVYYDGEHNYSGHDKFENLQEEAKKENKGLWDVCGKE